MVFTSSSSSSSSYYDLSSSSSGTPFITPSSSPIRLPPPSPRWKPVRRRRQKLKLRSRPKVHLDADDESTASSTTHRDDDEVSLPSSESPPGTPPPEHQFQVDADDEEGYETPTPQTPIAAPSEPRTPQTPQTPRTPISPQTPRTPRTPLTPTGRPKRLAAPPSFVQALRKRPPRSPSEKPSPVAAILHDQREYELHQRKHQVAMVRRKLKRHHKRRRKEVDVIVISDNSEPERGSDSSDAALEGGALDSDSDVQSAGQFKRARRPLDIIDLERVGSKAFDSASGSGSDSDSVEFTFRSRAPPRHKSGDMEEGSSNQQAALSSTRRISDRDDVLNDDFLFAQ